jgi:ClpP class serine protease
MQHPKILAAIESSRWAIQAAALESVLSIVQQDVSAVDYEIFHKCSQEKKEAIVASLGTPVEGTRQSYVNGSNGLIYIDGPIIPRADMFSEASGMVSIEGLTADYKTLQADSRVDRIILVMDTPGGVITGVSEFSQLVKNSSKPTDAFVYGMAASAGYWIASAVRTIYAADTAEVGSIGVVSTYRASKDTNYIEIVSSQSPNKRPDISTDAGKAQVQGVVDQLAQVFVETVAENRGVSAETVLSDFGAGGMMVAGVAIEKGMIDEITTLDKLLSEDEKKTMIHKTNGRTTMDAKEIVATYPEAAAEIRREAAEGERKRIAGIEELMVSVAASSEPVKKAAEEIVSAAKKDGNATAENTAVKVLAAVGKAQAEHEAAFSAAPRALAKSAEEIPSALATGGEGADEEKEKATVSGLVSGMKSATL